MDKQEKVKRPIENKIYASIIGICEGREHQGSYRGNGHHLAQELAVAVSIGLLPNQQRKLYDCLTKDYKSTKEISKETGIPSKNVSSQMRQMYEATLLIHKEQSGKLIKWRKNHE